MGKNELLKQVILGGRQYGISMVLFRHLIGEKLGINVTDMECLGLLFHKGIATPSELAHYTGLSSGATTAMLDRLEKNNIIKRIPNPADRRGTQIFIVKETANKIAPLFTSIRTAQEKLVASYSKEELAIIAQYFEKSITMWDDERKKLQTSA